MRSSDARRKLIFALALATLIVGAGVMAHLDRSEPVAGSTGASRARHAPAPPVIERQPPEIGGTLGAARSAGRFVRAYLRYEVGALRRGDREALSRFSTPQFGGELLRVPVRIPPGSRAPRQRVGRVAAVHVSLFDGKPALLVSVVVAGSTGAHLLRTSLIKRNGRWLVAGIGP
jgi:hypothetical protein